MRYLIPLIVLSLALPLWAGEKPQRGQVVFETGFDSPEALRGWSAGGQVVANPAGGQMLRISRPGGAAQGSSTVSMPLPVEKIRGCTLYCYATIKAENISAKPNPWNGVKFMLPVESPAGKTWPAVNMDAGSFDARRVSFAARIPADATAASLVLGLEQVTGTAWFDDVRIVIGKTPVSAVARPAAGPAYKGHNLPRLRGAMISPNIDEAGLRTLGQDWGANLIRWQLIRSGKTAQIKTPAEFDAWLDGELARLDAAIPHCRKYGLFIVIDLHSPFGGTPTSSGYVGSDGGLFTDKAAQDHFVRTWQRIARKYKGVDVIWGYDLANEPVEEVPGDGCDDWHALATRAGRAIREIDPDRALIVEPPDWGGPGALAHFEPIDVPNVVYSVHMYIPHQFTHQQLRAAGTPVNYPGVIEGKRWDRAALEEALKPAVEFQKRYNVHIYLGEFSAIRWAPGDSAHAYLKDAIDLFESYGWDWSYHAFREFHGWSVEHGPDRANTRPTAQPTDRQLLLMSWYRKNQGR